MTPPTHPSSSSFILLVEDNPQLLRVMTELLEFEGYATRSASGGIDALALLDATPRQPLLIVSDIMMDDMNGCEFLQRLRTGHAWPTTPLIFVTGKPMAEGICPGFDFLPDGYIEKPFNLTDFMAVIRAVVGSAPNTSDQT